jgi:RND family efflux transporter MFP subunit
MSEANLPNPAPEPPDAGEPLSPQARRDLEIDEIRKRARYHAPGIQRPPEVPPAPPRRTLTLMLGALVVLLVAGGGTIAAQVRHQRALAQATEREAVPTVAVVRPVLEAPQEDLVLPGSLQPWEESPIYARTNGYLLRWHKDIGARVGKGELLAEIDTPEVDQELNQARAARGQVQAQVELAKVSAGRWENLLKTHAVSAQQNDEQASGYVQAQANLAAADANVRRLEQLEGFKQVCAPFAGVVTRRNVDPGALINAGTGASPGAGTGAAAGRELFDLARVDPLRVYTSVPQAYAPQVKVGGRATVTLQEFPGQGFTGTIARTAQAIDPATLTLLTEVDLPNRDGRLLPGSFGQVHFHVEGGVNRVTMPVNALLFRAEGARAAVVGPDGRVALRPIIIGRDYGTTLEILGGLAPSDRIVVNPSDSLDEGQAVNVMETGP